jgi:hypothetical protein
MSPAYDNLKKTQGVVTVEAIFGAVNALREPGPL